jgi:hypothetical protein
VIPGVRGSLLSHDALEHVIPAALRGRLGEAGRAEALHGLRVWHRPLLSRLGPSASARMVFDHVAGPLAARLGYRPVPLSTSVDCYRAVLAVNGVTVAALLVTPWGQDLSAMWRDAVKHGIGLGVR